MPDELKIVLEDVKEKFDLVIEAVNGVNERLDRHEQAEEERFHRLENEVLTVKADVAVLKTDVSVLKTDVAVLKTDVSVLKTDVAILKTDVAEIRRDLDDHRDHTELHGQRKGKAS